MIESRQGAFFRAKLLRTGGTSSDATLAVGVLAGSLPQIFSLPQKFGYSVFTLGSRPPFVGIGKCVPADLEGYAKMAQLARLRQQGGGYLPEGIKAHDDCIKHYNKMNPDIESLCVSLRLFLADLKNFCLVKNFIT